MRSAYPRTRRNLLAILQLYNTTMFGLKANSQVISDTENLSPSAPDRQQRDSLLRRRLIGIAFIIGLVLLGLAFPMVI
jgi:hypothetical protein